MKFIKKRKIISFKSFMTFAFFFNIKNVWQDDNNNRKRERKES
jgi:hypothetical protein